MSINLEQVTAVAEKLVKAGNSTTYINVREGLGNTGSKSTILRLIREWRESARLPEATASTLSKALTNALVSELASCAAQARATIENKLIEAESDVAELAQAGEQMESELDELALKVTSLTTERDNIIGKSERQEIELTSLTERMEREQAATGKAQVELALEKLKLIDFQKRDLEQRSEIDCKNSALDAENKARVAAEQLAAVLDAKHENARELVAKADSHIELLSKQLADGARELQAVRSQSQAQQAEHASITREQQEAILQAQRASAEAIQQAQRSSVAAQEAITAAKGAEREAAELRGRLDVMQQLVKDAQTAG